MLGGRILSKDAKAMFTKNMITEEKYANESNLADDVKGSGNITNIETDMEHLVTDFPAHDQVVVDNVTLPEIEQTVVNNKESTASTANGMPSKGVSFKPGTGNDGQLQRAISAGLHTSSQVDMTRNQDAVDEIAQAAR